MNIMRQATALGIVSIGQTVIILAGGIDMSVSAIITLVSVFSAGFMAGRVAMIVPVVLFCLALGALVGVVNGLVWTRLGVQPFIVTLGTLSICQGIALVYTRGPVGSVPRLYRRFADAQVGPLPLPFLLFLVLLAAGMVLLHRTRFGRSIYAVGGNPETARLSGIAVNRIRLAAFIISGELAALTGLYLSSRMGSGDPTIGPGFELDSITATLIGGTSLAGGRGMLVGTAGGVLVIAVLSNVLNQLNIGNWYQQIIKGLILLAAISAYQQRG